MYSGDRVKSRSTAVLFFRNPARRRRESNDSCGGYVRHGAFDVSDNRPDRDDVVNTRGPTRHLYGVLRSHLSPRVVRSGQLCCTDRKNKTRTSYTRTSARAAVSEKIVLPVCGSQDVSLPRRDVSEPSITVCAVVKKTQLPNRRISRPADGEIRFIRLTRVRNLVVREKYRGPHTRYRVK